VRVDYLFKVEEDPLLNALWAAEFSTRGRAAEREFASDELLPIIMETQSTSLGFEFIVGKHAATSRHRVYGTK
jgi:hypothetical protein